MQQIISYNIKWRLLSVVSRHVITQRRLWILQKGNIPKIFTSLLNIIFWYRYLVNFGIWASQCPFPLKKSGHMLLLRQIGFRCFLKHSRGINIIQELLNLELPFLIEDLKYMNSPDVKAKCKPIISRNIIVKAFNKAIVLHDRHFYFFFILLITNWQIRCFELWNLVDNVPHSPLKYQTWFTTKFGRVACTYYTLHDVLSFPVNQSCGVQINFNLQIDCFSKRIICNAPTCFQTT